MLWAKLMGRTTPRGLLVKEGYLKPGQEEGRVKRTPEGGLPTHVREQREQMRGPHGGLRSLGQGQIWPRPSQTWEPKAGLEPISPANHDLKS